jgi:hypothetical protein
MPTKVGIHAFAETGTGETPPPDYFYAYGACASHPRLCLCKQKAWIPSCVGVTRRRRPEGQRHRRLV